MPKSETLVNRMSANDLYHNFVERSRVLDILNDFQKGSAAAIVFETDHPIYGILCGWL